MSGNYCRYYSHHVIVVTTVATENRMTTHAIFDVGHRFFLKIMYILPIGYEHKIIFQLKKKKNNIEMVSTV